VQGKLASFRPRPARTTTYNMLIYGGGREIRTPMCLAARWISSPLPCQLRLALRPERFSHTAPARGALALGLAVALLGVAAYGAVPWWLTPEDRIERCAAVVVLNGDAP